MHEPGLAVQRQQVAVTQDVGHAGVDAPVHRQVAGGEFLAQGDELAPIDGGLLVREDEEANLVVPYQDLDLVDELLRVASAVLAPELPLRAEATGERAATREVRHRDPDPERDVDVLVPVEQRPVRRQVVEVLDDRPRGRRHDLAVLEERDALDLPALRPVRACLDGTEQFDDDLLALAADDVVDPRRLAQDLRIHERGVDAAEHRRRARRRLPGQFQRLLRLEDHRGDGGREDHVRLVLADDLEQAVVGDVVGHRIDEAQVGDAGSLERAADIGHPARRPVAGNLRTAGVVVGLDHHHPHGQSPRAWIRRAQTKRANQELACV